MLNQEKILNAIMQEEGCPHTKKCTFCVLYIECTEYMKELIRIISAEINNPLQTEESEKLFKARKAAAIQHYASLYGEEKLFEVLL